MRNYIIRYFKISINMTLSRRCLLALGAVLLTVPAWAGIQTNARMHAAARRVLGAGGQVSRVADYQGMAVYHQAGGGFAIVSSDGNAPAVLAYSPDGQFDPTSDNPGFNWWLGAIKRAPHRDPIKPDPSRFAPSVAPLITTRWGQNEPFRYMCPFLAYEPDLSKYGIYLPDTTHNAVGCGPAAMAQYMYFYRYPDHGRGSRSVVVKYDQANVTLTVDFETATYEWDNMLDDYSGGYTDQQGEAVAQLCYHAAVAAQTNWTRLGGATFDENILNAMIEHFGYNDSARVLNRPLYDDVTWVEMIYESLSSGHPVLYSGKDINFEVGLLVGHNFIIDGYDENGLVHVNWGWHGQQDGYYDIATLTVGKLSFDDWQGMYTGLYPKREHLRGDVDGDGKVNITDVTTLIDILLTGSGNYVPAADVDEDGKVNITDLTTLIDILLTGNTIKRSFHL